MNPQPQIQNSITTSSMDAQDHNQDLHLNLDNGNNLDLDLDDEHNNNTNNLDHDLHNDNNLDLDDEHNINTDNLDLDHETDGDDLDADDNDMNGENMQSYEQNPLYCTDNNPPESFSICQAKVADWLEHHTFIERKASVKFAVVTKNQDSTQTRSTHRSMTTLNQRPKLSIIGFRKKQIHQPDGKSKHNDKPENIRLFRNRSEPGRDYCLLITEPVSPKVSCVGRVGSVRVRGRKAGVWRSVKAAFSNLVQTNRVMKIIA
ncbi:unnamed protein product [Lactuca saligna]|uniref:Uncharacterized protein n=1 Tax=Lactuca saligna TaxID=75948 RepID=A0AA35ZP10_LACSI|nr:unnamed protein product [Lactuca saligna]